MNSIAIIVICLALIGTLCLFIYWLTWVWYVKRTDTRTVRHEEPVHIEDVDLHSVDPRTWPRRDEVPTHEQRLKAPVDEYRARTRSVQS
ncbi:hypothetical protein CBER1_07568 [Cercospora berteroae]|uniref:Uncharacterized protein n=1 Tax=Cercospora berteroae TaxID=357750 RepID=A0A2S6CK36_9PEZI|nr:hypothetical protein CBER1_07568 [Cercospora berteroae]